MTVDTALDRLQISPERFAFQGIRSQIRDLVTENIALLAVRAREIGDVGVRVLRAVKAELDPTGILNPGVRIP